MGNSHPLGNHMQERERRLSDASKRAFRNSLSKAVSISYKVDLDKHVKTGKSIRVKVRAARDRIATVVEETFRAVIFKTPTIRMEAIVTLPALDVHQTWDIGWVQACTFIKFCNRYGDLGFTSWEFPQMNNGKRAVNDSSGKCFPFYGNRKEMQTIVGPTRTPTKVLVSMNDSPMSQVTLKIPSTHINTGRKCDLTHIERKQKFCVWLVARCQDTGEIFPLKSFSWEVDIHITVNAMERNGVRATLLEPKIQPQPRLFEHTISIPEEALSPPDCNRAQMLLWRPLQREQKLSLIVAPSYNKNVPSSRELTNEMVYTEKRY